VAAAVEKLIEAEEIGSIASRARAAGSNLERARPQRRVIVKVSLGGD